jgi:hypothetical protein
MPGIITTGNHPKALWPGINAWFGVSYKERPIECTMVFDEESSEKAYEEDVEASGFGLAPIKQEGSAVSYDSQTQGYTKRYTHVAYALGYIVTKEERADNLYEKVSKSRARSLAFSMRQTKEVIGANVFNNGFDTNYTGGDGKPLFSATHTSLNGSWSNLIAVAADLSEASLEDQFINIMNATNSRGLKIALTPQKLIVPAERGLQRHPHRQVRTAERHRQQRDQRDPFDGSPAAGRDGLALPERHRRLVHQDRRARRARST